MEAPPKEGTLRRTKCGLFWYFDPPPSVDKQIQLIEDSVNRMLSTRILKRWVHLFKHVCDLFDEKGQLIKAVALAKLHATAAAMQSACLMLGRAPCAGMVNAARQPAAQAVGGDNHGSGGGGVAVPNRGWQDLEGGWQDWKVNRGWQGWGDSRWVSDGEAVSFISSSSMGGM